MLALFFAAVAVLLAGIGLYGVLDYSVLQRRREFGIHIAVGAPAGHIARQVIADVFSMVVLGAAAGECLGLVLEPYIKTLPHYIPPSDPGVLILPCLIIATAALLTALPPVFRAIRIYPVDILRAEQITR